MYVVIRRIKVKFNSTKENMSRLLVQIQCGSYDGRKSSSLPS